MTLNRRYVVERELRRAGVATVYLARDLEGDDRPVAVKVLRPELTATLGAERLVESLSATVGLGHPNILPIVDVGVVDGAVYYVTPHVDAETLRERLERERQLPIDEALRIGGGVAAALDFAHQQGVLHLDLKPEKILLRSGQPLVADFGLALALAGAAREQNGEAAIFGTPGYISPEQAAGDRTVDGRSDQYSLACVLYEMLAGEPPYTAPTPQGAVVRMLTEPPPPLTAVRVVPRIMERAIDRALAKVPENRFGSAGELIAAVQGGSATPPLHSAAAVPSPARPRRWRAVLIASLAVVTIGAGIAMGSRVVAGRRTPNRAAAHRQLTFTGSATSPDLSPDGRSVAYVAAGRALLVRPLEGGTPVPVVPAAGGILAFRWTRDGRALVVAMTRDSTDAPATYLVPAAGGAARKVVDDARPFDTGVDSTVIVRAPRDRGRLEIVSLASGKPVRRITLPDSLDAIAEVAWSPDGRWLAFTEAAGALWVVPAAGGGSPTRVAEGARTVRWAPGSDALYFLSGPAGAVELLRVGTDPRSGGAVAGATRVTSLLAADAFDIAADKLVHTQTTRSPQARTFVLGGPVPRRVIEERPLGEGGARISAPAVSPDGQWVAYTAARGAERDIHIVAFGGGSPRIVAATSAREESPTWSPDGSRLTFAREDSSGRGLVMADARSGAAQRVGSLPGPGATAPDSVAPRDVAATARWSASGRHVAYYAQDRRRIAVVNLQRRNESAVRVPESAGNGRFTVLPSPNGTQLLASTIAPRDDRAALWLVFGNGRRWRRIAGPPGETVPVAWYRNGWIYLVRNRALATDHGSLHFELWRMRGPLGRPEPYAALPEGCGAAVSISADATHGVCSYVRVESDLYVAGGAFGGAAGR